MNPIAKISEKRLIIFLLVFALLLRLVVVFLASHNAACYLTDDSHDYLYLANSLYTHFDFVNKNGAEIFRMPGYPFFISLIWMIFHKALIPVLIVQALIDTATCFLTWVLFRKLFKEHGVSSYLAILFQIISIAAIVFTSKILSESLFTFLFVLLLVQIESGLNNKNSSLIYFTSGFTVAFLCLVRAVALPLVIPFAVYLWFRTRNIFAVIKFIVPVVLVLGLWGVRNYCEADYAGLSSVGAVNLYRYNACSLLAETNKISFAEQQQICDRNLSYLLSAVDWLLYLNPWACGHSKVQGTC